MSTRSQPSTPTSSNLSTPSTTSNNSSISSILYTPYLTLPPTTLELFTVPALASSPYLSSLVILINRTFSHGYTKGKGLIPATVNRLENSQQLITEYGPNAFVYVLFRNDSEGTEGKRENDARDCINRIPIASIGAQPFLLPKLPPDFPETKKAFKRTVDPGGDAYIQYEIKLLVVDPIYQGHGLGGRLFDILIEEIRARVDAMNRLAEETGGARRKGKLLLTTLGELNEPFYERRGFVTSLRRRFEPPMYGTVDGFTVVHMERNL